LELPSGIIQSLLLASELVCALERHCARDKQQHNAPDVRVNQFNHCGQRLSFQCSI